MRVLYFHQYFTTRDGSSGTRSYEMAKRLVARGHQVTMVCGWNDRGKSGLHGEYRKGLRQGRVDGIEVIEIELAYSNSLGLLRRAWMFFRFALRSIGVVVRTEYDVMIATSTPLTVGIPAIAGRFLRGKPYVFEVRDQWPELPRAMGVVKNPLILWGMSLLEWISYRAADRCIGLSPGIVAGIRRRAAPHCPVRMIPNGCDLELFFPDPHQRTRPPGVAPTDFMAIFTGAHGLANGLDAVLDAALELKQRGQDRIKLVLIGDGKLKPALQGRAREQNLDNCLFLDLVTKRELTALQRGADVGLMILADIPAFYYGTSPNKFFDYIATGLPVLINYPGWLAEIITEHGCGMVVPPGRPQAFADALEYLACHPVEASAMGKRARALGESTFGRSLLADRFADWIEEAHGI